MLILGKQLSLQILSVCAADLDGENEFSGEEEMAGRTPAILPARELFYKACDPLAIIDRAHAIFFQVRLTHAY